MTEISVQRKIIEILRILSEAENPVGARKIGDMLNERGYNIGERAVRYHLSILDEQGFTKKHGYHGRTITDHGRRELEEALVTDRLNFVMTKVESMIYKSSFDPQKGDGDVVVNLSIIAKDRLDDAIRLLEEVASSNLISPQIKLADEGELMCGEIVPEGRSVIATLCSITVDGVFLKRGIPAELKFGGLVKIRDYKCDGFVEYIGYRGTTIDPIKIFLSKRMTDVSGAIKGDGLILANYREVPVAAKEEVKKALTDLKSLKIGKWMYDSSDIILYAGVNGIAYLEENGIKTDTRPNAALMPFKELMEI